MPAEATVTKSTTQPTIYCSDLVKGYSRCKMPAKREKKQYSYCRIRKKKKRPNSILLCSCIQDNLSIQTIHPRRRNKTREGIPTTLCLPSRMPPPFRQRNRNNQNDIIIPQGGGEDEQRR